MDKTTQEYLNIVSAEGRVIGKATRDQCHSDASLIHSVVHCWIFNSDNQVLIQKRSKAKKVDPGVWDISCAGHIGYAELPVSTIIREAYEELGLLIKPILIHEYIKQKRFETEYIYLYSARLNSKNPKLELQISELEAVKWIDLDLLRQKILSSKIKIASDWLLTQMPIIVESLGIETRFNR